MNELDRNYAVYTLERIKREIAARRAARDAARSVAEAESVAVAATSKPLHLSIQEWWQRLDESQRKPSYTMEELAAQFQTSAGRIGMALHQLGWQRKRYWAGNAAYRRHWIPVAS